MNVIVFGATGLVGKAITQRLLKNPSVSKVHLFVRRSTNLVDNKLIETIVDFNHFDDWKNEIKGDILFSALGTTVKTAGSKDAQFTVDYQYQLQIAVAASENKIKKYILISSVNANSRSNFFYLHMKGLLEEKVMMLPFESICILRPGPLKGKREKIRVKEIISTKILDMIPKFLISSGLRPVEAEQVASVAVSCGLSKNKGVFFIGPKEIIL